MRAGNLRVDGVQSSCVVVCCLSPIAMTQGWQLRTITTFESNTKRRLLQWSCLLVARYVSAWPGMAKLDGRRSSERLNKKEERYVRSSLPSRGYSARPRRVWAVPIEAQGKTPAGQTGSRLN